MLWCLFWNANLLEGEFVWCVRTWPHQLFMQSFTITKLLVVLYNNLASILPSLACNNCLASRQRQRDNDNATTTTRQRNGPLETRKNVKHFKAWVSKWSSHNECRHNALINSFFYLKTWSHCCGIVVACPAPLFSQSWVQAVTAQLKIVFFLHLTLLR